MNILFPHKIYNRITDIPIEYLKAKGIRGIILDVDNTLTTHDNPLPSCGVLQWLDTLKAASIKPIILSNNSSDRVQKFADMLGLPFVARGAKPLPLGYWRCGRVLGLKRKQMVVVGDQLFTDTLGGRICGLLCILVEPIELEKMSFFRFKRKLERIILKKYEKRYGR